MEVMVMEVVVGVGVVIEVAVVGMMEVMVGVGVVRELQAETIQAKTR